MVHGKFRSLCSTVFLGAPMAILCEFANQATEMASRNCEPCCLPNQFLGMQSVVCVPYSCHGHGCYWFMQVLVFHSSKRAALCCT